MRNWYYCAQLIAKPKAAGALHALQSWAATSSKYDIIHKTGSTQRITTPPEEDRATAIGHMHRSFVEDRTCSFEDMKANRQTHYTYTQTDTFLTKRRSPIHGRPHIGANGVS